MFLNAYSHFLYLSLSLMGSKWSVDYTLNSTFLECPDKSCFYNIFLNRYASSIDDILEDEEHYADQLKEYLFYAEALR